MASEPVWTWVKSANDKRSSYGTKGNASGANAPGARDGAAAWTGKDGKLWLFGGQAVWLTDPEGVYGEGYTSDLWYFDRNSTNGWNWVKGSGWYGYYFNSFMASS